jgi:hypothetical protein
VTATMPHADAVDIDGLFKRIDARYARKAGDDPAPAAYIKAFADAIRPHLGQSVAAPVDDVQVKQLLADKQRLSDLAEELRKQAETRGGVIDRQVHEIAELKKWASELKHHVDEARAERDTARAQLRDRPIDDTVRQKLAAAAADVTVKEKLAAAAEQVAQLTEQLAAANRDLALANRTLDEIADEEANRPDAGPHRHLYELDPATGQHKPCECKQPWIRGLVDEGEPVVPDVEPLDQLFARIRSEWPEPTP